MGIGEDDLLKSSVTVMPVFMGKIGFNRRDAGDTFENLLVAPGGSLETPDGELIEGVRYFAAEYAAVRELREKAGMNISRDSLRYFCTIALPGHRSVKHRLIVSYYCLCTATQIGRSFGWLEFYNYAEISVRMDFVPGMKMEALALLRQLGFGPAQKNLVDSVSSGVVIASVQEVK